MHTLLTRLLVVAALGLIATGVVVGLVHTAGCDGYETCNGFRSPAYRWVPIVLIGLGLTSVVAAFVVEEAKVKAGKVQPSPTD